MRSLGTDAQIFTGLVIAAAVKYSVSWWMRKRREKLFVKIGQVSTLYIYPVKSCKAVEVTGGECTLYGLKCNGVYDRYLCRNMRLSVTCILNFFSLPKL